MTPRSKTSVLPEDELDHYADLAGTVMRLAREVRLREFHTEDELVVLPASNVQVMQYVDAHPGVTPSEVAEATGLQRTNTSTAVRQLQKIGFLEKRDDPDDGRTVHLYSTEMARANLDSVRRAWGTALHTVLEGATEGVSDATALLDRIAERLAADRRTSGLTSSYR